MKWIYCYKGWFYLNIFNFLCLDISNPFRIMRKVKKVFVPLKCKFYHGKNTIGNIYMGVKPNLINIKTKDVMWKDKFDSPRFEASPIIWIHLFGYNLVWSWELDSSFKNEMIDDWWEQVLWYLYYYNTYSQGLLDEPDINKARESWPWVNMETNESSWNDNFLTNDYRLTK